MTPAEISQTKEQVAAACYDAQAQAERHAFREQADFDGRMVDAYFGASNLIGREAGEPLDEDEEQELRGHLLDLAALCLALAALRRVPEAA